MEVASPKAPMSLFLSREYRRIKYNTERPHQALQYGTPAAFAVTWAPPKEAAD